MGPLIMVKVFGDHWWLFELSSQAKKAHNRQIILRRMAVKPPHSLTDTSHCYPPSRSCGTHADLRSEVSQSNRRAGRSYVNQGPHSRRQGPFLPAEALAASEQTFINKRVNVTEASPRSGGAQGARFIISPRLSERNVWDSRRFVLDQRWQPACLRIINHQRSV